jgi:hypothetical protein
LITTTICYRCKTAFTCIGAQRKACSKATRFRRIAGVWQPVCSDEKECAEIKQSGEAVRFVWRSVKRSKETCAKK